MVWNCTFLGVCNEMACIYRDFLLGHPFFGVIQPILKFSELRGFCKSVPNLRRVLNLYGRGCGLKFFKNFKPVADRLQNDPQKWGSKKQHYWDRWIFTCLSSAVFRPVKNDPKNNPKNDLKFEEGLKLGLKTALFKVLFLGPNFRPSSNFKALFLPFLGAQNDQKWPQNRARSRWSAGKCTPFRLKKPACTGSRV